MGLGMGTQFRQVLFGHGLSQQNGFLTEVMSRSFVAFLQCTSTVARHSVSSNRRFQRRFLVFVVAEVCFLFSRTRSRRRSAPQAYDVREVAFASAQRASLHVPNTDGSSVKAQCASC